MPLKLLKSIMKRLDPKAWIRACEERWFDATRHVQTAGNVSLGAVKVVGKVRDSHIYVPARVANAHAALHDLPMGPTHGTDYSDHTFIDIGSGKGRVLFVAAEYSFRK